MQLGKKGLLLLIILLSTFAPFSTDMFLAGLPDMVVYFDTNEQIMSMTLYGFMLSLAISILIIGPISDKYGRRKVLIISLLIYIAMTMACSFSTSIWMLILFRVLQAVGAGGAMAISVALIKDCFIGKDMSLALSATAVLGVLGPVLAPVIGTALLEIAGWESTFWATAVLAGICLVMSLFISSTIPEERYDGTIIGSLANLTVLLRNRDFTKFTVMMSIFTVALLGYVGVSSYIYQEQFGVSSVEYSGFLAATVLLGVAGMLILQKLNPRFGSRWMLKVFLVLTTVSAVLMFTVGQVGTFAFMAAMLPISIIAPTVRSYGFEILMNQYNENAGSVSSILNFSTFAFGCIGMVIASIQFTDSFVISVGICVLIALAVFVVLLADMYKNGTTIKELN